jgi:hypothetical protein
MRELFESIDYCRFQNSAKTQEHQREELASPKKTFPGRSLADVQMSGIESLHLNEKARENEMDECENRLTLSGATRPS